MSTPTPRTEEAWQKWLKFGNSEYLKDASLKLQTELTAANAEIETLKNELSKTTVEFKTESQYSSLQFDELTAANAKIAELEKEVSELRPKLTRECENHDASMRRIDALESAAIDGQQRAESLTRQLSEAQERERVAIASWDEERERALREVHRVVELRAQLAKRAENVSREEANELRDVLRTLVPSGRAFITSARELVQSWENQKTEIQTLEAQLASAREDSARLDWLESRPASIEPHMQDEKEAPCTAASFEIYDIRTGEWFECPHLRSAIDSARGVTSPPAVAETGQASTKSEDECPECGEDLCRDEVDIAVGILCGPWFCQSCGWRQDRTLEEIVDSLDAKPTPPPQGKDTSEKNAWQPIETAPKDGTVILASSPNWRRATEMKWNSEIETFYFMNGTHPMFDPPTVWQPLPPPPQGKEK